MAEQTADERRQALVERLADAINKRTWDIPDDESVTAACLDAAEATVALLESEGRLIEPGDLQGSVAIVIDQLRVARTDLTRYRAVIGNACELLDEDWPATAAEFRRVAGLLPP